MVNGRDTMMDSIDSELTFLDSMRKSGIENIKDKQAQVKEAQDRLRLADELQARFEKRSEMCWDLKHALEVFGSGMDDLKAT